MRKNLRKNLRMPVSAATKEVAVTEAPSIPARETVQRPSRVKNHEAVNLYLTIGRKGPASKIAVERYNYSLSELVDKLLEREMSLKDGLLRCRVWMPKK